MEVHHHPHVEKKSFKEYLLEGLMIFIAVSMGFIAESVREHITETKHEKEYMKALVKDLQLDTAYINISNNTREKAIASAKILLQYFKDNPSAEKLPVNYRVYIDTARSLRIFINHSGAIDQLKSSGSIRLVKSRALVDSIESYYNQIKRIDNLNNIYLTQQQNESLLHNKLIVAKDDINNYDSAFNYMIHQENNKYFSLNKDYLNEYINTLFSLIRTNRGGKRIHQDILNKAVQLMGKINEEYGFEKE